MSTRTLTTSSLGTALGGKVLQVVRATDSTSRSTTSATLADVTGMSVTISPQRSNSAVLLLAFLLTQNEGDQTRVDGVLTITDSSNNAISGAQLSRIGLFQAAAVANIVTLSAYDTPGSTNAKTYKIRFRIQVSGGTNVFSIRNDNSTGQLFAIELAA